MRCSAFSILPTSICDLIFEVVFGMSQIFFFFLAMTLLFLASQNLAEPIVAAPGIVGSSFENLGHAITVDGRAVDAQDGGDTVFGDRDGISLNWVDQRRNKIHFCSNQDLPGARGQELDSFAERHILSWIRSVRAETHLDDVGLVEAQVGQELLISAAGHVPDFELGGSVVLIDVDELPA